MIKSDATPLLILAGPTAVGKSALALELAKRIPIEIISADARQVYRGLDIGTAKPTLQEQSVCKHHCIDIRNPDESYSASEYMHDARNAIANVQRDTVAGVQRSTLAVMVGGSGMYISAAIDGLSVDAVSPDEELRNTLQERMDREGKEKMYFELQQLDPPAAEKYHDQNPRRILRALEYIHLTGKTFSSSWEAERTPYAGTVLPIVVACETDVLNARIDKRCDYMWNNGLLKETTDVLSSGVSEHAQSLSTVGYREAIFFLDGRMKQDQALAAMKVSTKQYAKRQRTWFRKDENNVWIQQPTVDDLLLLLRSHPSFSAFVDL